MLQPRSPLTPFKPKRFTKPVVDRVWEDIQSGNRARRRLLPGTAWGRETFAVSRSVLGTVRRFNMKNDAKRYMRNSILAEKEIMNAQPKNFVLQPVQYIAIRGCDVLERVYPGVPLDTFYTSRPPGHFLLVTRKRIEKRFHYAKIKCDWEEVIRVSQAAGQELNDILGAKGSLMTRWPVNRVLLDYDPLSKKALIALVDKETPVSIPED